MVWLVDLLIKDEPVAQSAFWYLPLSVGESFWVNRWGKSWQAEVRVREVWGASRFTGFVVIGER